MDSWELVLTKNQTTNASIFPQRVVGGFVCVVVCLLFVFIMLLHCNWLYFLL